MIASNGNECLERWHELERRGIPSGPAREIMVEEHAFWHEAVAATYEAAKEESLEGLTFRKYDESLRCVLSLHVYQRECPICGCHFVLENLTEDEDDDDLLIECIGCGTVWLWEDWDDWDCQE